MIDPAFVRDYPDIVRAGLRNRGIDPDADLDALASLDARRRAVIVEVETLKREQNTSGEEIARAKKEGRDPSAVFAANRERGQTDQAARSGPRRDRGGAARAGC